MADPAAPGLERGSGVSLWRQIASAITADIERGMLRVGDSLPPERMLAERFGVNRHTIRQSMAALAEDGLVRVEQGRGTFVQDVVLDYRLTSRTRFSEIVSRQNRTPGGRLLRSAEMEATPAIVAALGGDASRCVLLETLSEADGRPISIGAHHFPMPRFARMPVLFAETGSISAALARLGVTDYARQSTRVMARLPDAEEARLLRQPRNRPVLVTEAVNADSDGEPIEFGIARFASDRVQILVES